MGSQKMKDPKGPKEDLAQQEDEGIHQHNPQTPPSVQGEEEISGTSPSPTSDDDTDQMIKEVSGDEPKPGQTIGDIVNEDEKARHGLTPQEEEAEED